MTAPTPAGDGMHGVVSGSDSDEKPRITSRTPAGMNPNGDLSQPAPVRGHNRSIADGLKQPQRGGKHVPVTVEPLVSAEQLQDIFLGHDPGGGFWERMAAELNVVHAAVVAPLIAERNRLFIDLAGETARADSLHGSIGTVCRQRDAARAEVARLTEERDAYREALHAETEQSDTTSDMWVAKIAEAEELRERIDAALALCDEWERFGYVIDRAAHEDEVPAAQVRRVLGAADGADENGDRG